MGESRQMKREGRKPKRVRRERILERESEGRKKSH